MSTRAPALVVIVFLAGLVAGCLPDNARENRDPDTAMGTPIPAPDSSSTADAGADTGPTETTDTSDRDTDGPNPDDAEAGPRDARDARVDASDTANDASDMATDPSDAAATDTAPETTHRDTTDTMDTTGTTETTPRDTTDTTDTTADTGRGEDTVASDTSTRDTRSPTDAGTDTSTRDAHDATDTFIRDTIDSGPPDTAPTCSPSCGTNAHCASGTCVCDAGYEGEPTGTCYQPKSCQTRSDCGSFTLCVDGECTCEPGFERKNSKACTRPSVGAPANRTKSEVCDRWTSRTSNLTSSIWATNPASQCATGILKPIVQWEALESTNIYRWLIGLDPLHARDSYIDKNQQCATSLAAEGKLTHNVTSSFACYTRDAADGASSSNVAFGRTHPAETIRPYVRDKHVSTLGHRRWIFSPSVGATGFGHRGRYGCMWTLDGSGTDAQQDMFYPAPGSFPDAALVGDWSYLSAAKLDPSNASVSVTAAATGQSMMVSNVNRLTHGAYGRVTGVSWEVPNATTGTAYKVTISGLGSNGSTTKSYKTTLVNCP